MQARAISILLVVLFASFLATCLLRSVSAETYVAGANPKYAQEVNSGVTLELNVTGAQGFTTYTFTWRVTAPTGTLLTLSKSTNSGAGSFSQSVVFPRDFGGASTNYVGNYTVRIDQTAPFSQSGVANTRFEIGLMPAKTIVRTYLIVAKALGYSTGENVTIDIRNSGVSLPGFPSSVIANTTQGEAIFGWRPTASTPTGQSTVSFRGSSTLKFPSDTQVVSVLSVNLTGSGFQIIPGILQRTQTLEVRFSGTYSSGVPVLTGNSLIRLVESDGMTTHFFPASYDSGIGLFRGTYRVGLGGLAGTWTAYLDVNSVDDGYGDVGPSSVMSASVGVQPAVLSISVPLSQSYTPGDQIGFFVTVTSPDGSLFSSGTLSLTMTNNGAQVGNRMGLTYVPSQGYWTGLYVISQNDPTGLWAISVDASDGYGNHGQGIGTTTVGSASLGPPAPQPLVSLPLFLFLIGAAVAGSTAGGLYLLKGRVAVSGGYGVPLDVLSQLTGGEIPAKSTVLILAGTDEDASSLGIQLASRDLQVGNYCGLLAYGSSPSALLRRLRRFEVGPRDYQEKGLLDVLDCNSRDPDRGGVANPLDIVDVGVRVGLMLEKKSGTGPPTILLDSLSNVVKSSPARKVLGFLSFLAEKVKNENGILLLAVQKEAMTAEMSAGLTALADGIIELGGTSGKRTLEVHKTFGRQVKPRPVEYQERSVGLVSRLREYLDLD